MCHKVTRMESLQHPLGRCKSPLWALQETALLQIFNLKRGFFLFTTCVMMTRCAGMKANIGTSPLTLTANPPKCLPSHHRTRELGTWHLGETTRHCSLPVSGNHCTSILGWSKSTAPAVLHGMLTCNELLGQRQGHQ